MTARIVRMFEHYSANINPEDPSFQEFIRKYVAKKEQKDAQTVAYSELYKIVREGIQEYMTQTRGNPKK